MVLIQRLDCCPKVDGPSVACAVHNATVDSGSVNERVTNRLTSKRHKTERLTALVLMCAGVGALAAGLPELSALFWIVGVSLYAHSRFIALWSDDG